MNAHSHILSPFSETECEKEPSPKGLRFFDFTLYNYIVPSLGPTIDIGFEFVVLSNYMQKTDILHFVRSIYTIPMRPGQEGPFQYSIHIYSILWCDVSFHRKKVLKNWWLFFLSLSDTYTKNQWPFLKPTKTFWESVFICNSFWDSCKGKKQWNRIRNIADWRKSQGLLKN